MTDLHDLFHGTAEQVAAYDVAPAVLRAARRRRRVTALTPVAAAVAALAVVMSAVLFSPSGTAPVPGGPVPTGHPSRYLDPSNQTLPFNDFHGISAGRLTYRMCTDTPPCVDYLVTVTGLQFTLTGLDDEALSPDGRWFTYTDDGTTHKMRDLNGTDILDLGNRRPAGWSADGGWLALTTDATAGQPVHTVETVAVPDTHGTTIALPGNQRRPFAGLTSDGSAVFGPTTDLPGIVVATRDGTYRTVPVPGFADNAAGTTMPGLDDNAVVIVAEKNILRIDLASGAVLQQIPLAPGFDPPILQTSGHRLVVLSDDLLETIDLVTGRNTVLNQLPAGSSFRFAGSSTWVLAASR